MHAIVGKLHRCAHKRMHPLSVVLLGALSVATIIGMVTVTLSPVGAQPAPVHADAAGLELFEKRIRPLLAAKCYDCHASSGKQAMGGFALDSRDALRKGGTHGPAIIAGKPESSLLLRAVGYIDKSLQMPPSGKLNDSEIAALTEWVRIGAPDPRTSSKSAPVHAALHGMSVEAGRAYWAFQPLASSVKPPHPHTATGPASSNWARTDIDRFILVRLQASGLKPNPIADRRTLIRRACMDLIGLPPTPREVDQFIHDTAPDAYARLIDRLLASPHYGERWGRHWLDLARFAESHGYEQDYDRNYAYQYRDFVIKALNEDLPYDTFVRWQIAGDEFAPQNPMALMATGFLGAGTHATQITKNQVEKERYDELDDMVSTTSLTMLGLTMGCARCHDHKYDPIPNRDYYRMLSTFTTTVRSDYDINVDPEGYKREKTDFDRATTPLQDALLQYEKQELPARFATWIASKPKTSEIEKNMPAVWYQLTPARYTSAGGATFTLLPDGSLRAGGKNPVSDVYTIVAYTGLQSITAIRLEAMADTPLVRGGPGRADNGNFALSDFKVTIAPASGDATAGQTSLKLINPRATFEQPGLPIRAAIDDDANSAWAIDPQFGKNHAAAFDIASPVGFEKGSTLTFTLKFNTNTGHNIGRLRLAVSTLPSPAKAALDGLTQDESVASAKRALERDGAAALSDANRTTLYNWFRTTDAGWQSLNNQLQSHLAKEPKPKLEKAMICSEGVPAIRNNTQGGDFLEQTHFLKRGDPSQKVGVATQSFLQVLMRTPEGEKRWIEAPPTGSHTSYRRRSLANWITDTQQGAGCLMARVIVNRLWQHHIGRGIVSTPSDFGMQGERPTHPELLDWLAGELIHNGWKLKSIHKLIMTSAVYMQSGAVDSERIHKDPENRLCWYHPRQRLEAELVRDSMLSVSGLLDQKMFGPGTLDEAQRRRSIYFFVKRSQLVPSMTLFDAPNALQSIAVRATTTVAPQALLLMNGTRTREYARALALRVTASVSDPLLFPDAISIPDTSTPMTVRRAYQLTLGRDPDRLELADSMTFLNRQSTAYGTTGGTGTKEMAMTDLCQVLMSLNEFIYID